MTGNQALERAKDLILAGEVVGLPTETVYGLAASIESEIGLKKIFSIKERPFFDPLIVHISDLDQKKRVVSDWPPIADLLARSFWPGPLTMVLPKNPKLNPLITSGLETVGIRMPAHPVARALIDLCGVPLAAPSANKFGKTSPTKAEHVVRGFEKENLFILDGGPSEVGLESTVVSLQKIDGKEIVTILRPGAITKKMLEECLKTQNSPFSIERASSMASPGNTEHHYMPNIPLVIVEQEALHLKKSTQNQICKQFQLDENSAGIELKLDSSPKIAARSLYVKMRECGDSGADFIYVIKNNKSTDDFWDAVWDRLSRAASLKI